MISDLCDTLWIIIGSQMSKALFTEAETAGVTQTGSAKYSTLKNRTNTETFHRSSLYTGDKNREFPVHGRLQRQAMSH